MRDGGTGVAGLGVGCGDMGGDKLPPVNYGCIRTVAQTTEEERLRHVYEGMVQLIDKYQPDAVAVEKLFFSRHVTTALPVAQARGVLILAAVQSGLPVAEYTPMMVKRAVVGYGKEERKQEKEMVKLRLKLTEVPQPDEVADARDVV
ncbi:crossover junction endodeoxyribonuclease RuvC [Paenibacillus jilunlii]|uniref:Crossover junction endodeoxyribonuclease RuvC n=1 Tax=Paenibacillus jilunlii TaxID=682956 RepID=A0ABR5T1P7_9BACL|nr:crossover junction endodeoxyribonuclease RuvC [Paenibacillus jilunlii]KWX81371.1 Holliday junction resolvase [Paenibacillus jilunlii]